MFDNVDFGIANDVRNIRLCYALVFTVLVVTVALTAMAIFIMRDIVDDFVRACKRKAD